MKKLIIIAAILLFPIQALCAPFLTCDCTLETGDKKVTGFQLQFGTQPVIDIPAVDCIPATPDGKRIWYDLGTMPNGPFSVKAAARNIWQVSDWTNPLLGDKAKPSSPSLLRITP